MSKRQSENGSNPGNCSKGPVFANASSVALPTTFEQAISEVPSGIKSSVIPPAVKLTSSSVTKLIKRNAIIATHWYNTPLVDGLKSVSNIYKMVEAAAFNYQRTHQDAFFEAYPELVIAKSTEGMTTADLRRNYRTYAARIAHYWYEYGEAKKMQLATLLNLMTMTRYNGNETLKHLASDMRWSRINTSCVLSERFPSPVGLESYMTGHTRYAVGKTTFGADIVSIGLWKADVLGTVGQKTLPLDNFILSDRKGDLTVVKDDTVMSAYEGAGSLVDTIGLVLSQYATEGNVGPFGQVVTAPDIENGVTRAISYGTSGLSTPLNRTGSTEFNGKFGVTSVLSKNLWAAYDMWTNHLTWAFPEMLDPNNDRYTFACEQLHLFEPSSKLEDIIKVIRSNDNYDITSLANLMVYKAKNSANSATIVKWAPALYDPSDTSLKPFEDDTLITLNSERFDITNPNTVGIIQSAKLWPHLNPTMFVRDSQNSEEPLVLNSSITAGQMGVPVAQQSDMNRVISPTGKYATMIDFAVSSSVAPDVSRITGFGMAEKAFTQYIEDGNSIVYEELPDSPWLMRQPLIDSSDLAQCGFNILVSHDDPNPNEWVKYLTEKRNYVDSTAGNFVGTIGTNYVPASHGIGQMETIASITCYMKAHVTNPNYRELREHMLVFVGVGIFSHPWFCGGKKTSGYFLQHHRYSKTGTTVPAEIARLLVPQQGDPSWAFSFAQMNTLASEFTADPNDASNPASAILEVLQQEVTAKDLDIYDFIFSPDYGPIDIGACVPEDQDDNMVPPFMSGNFPSVGQDNAVTPEIGFTDMSVGSSLTGVNVGPVNATLKAALYDPLLSPCMWLVYFLDTVQFPKVLVDTYGGYTVSPADTPVVLHFGDISKWKYSLMSRVVSQFVGIHDTLPFWDNADMSIQSFSIESSSRFPENNILAEPRRVQAEKVNTGRNVTGGKYDGKSETESAAGYFRGNKSHSGKFRKASKGNKDKEAYKADSGVVSESGVKINSDATANVETEMAQFGKDGSPIDLSSKKEDKEFKSRSNKPMSQNNMLGTV